ncbi:hypothetical protein [Salinispora cortesiana]|uniref:hypothetical protein n=1 Tax=Salinispora cortesiana TaxID=1305843 RepID=UPI0003FA377C|nr:hypothetical protein [Salinispora cortesiana]
MLSYLHPRVSVPALVGLVLPMAFLSGCGEDAPGRTVEADGIITFVAPETNGGRDGPRQ